MGVGTQYGLEKWYHVSNFWEEYHFERSITSFPNRGSGLTNQKGGPFGQILLKVKIPKGVWFVFQFLEFFPKMENF
jgi:hypothetical protein